MTESMRTRVARAYRKWRFGFESNKPCDELDLSLADAVIEAMRVPTDAMIEAAIIAPGDGNLGVDARNTWQAMIDAALGERE